MAQVLEMSRLEEEERQRIARGEPPREAPPAPAPRVPSPPVAFEEPFVAPPHDPGFDVVASEDEMIAQAIRMSQMDDETRQRQELRQQQEMELQESMLMDQMREQEARRQGQEEEQLRRMEEQRLADERCRAEQEAAAREAELVAKRARIPAEPAAGEPGRVDIQIRLTDGKRLRRAFRGTETIGLVYDFVDLEGGEAVPRKYRLVSTMPRRAYEARNETLAAVGLEGQCALLVEAIQDAA